MSLAKHIEILFKKYLPSPFTIAIILSGLSLILALSFSTHDFIELMSFWEKGMWNAPLLVFAFQMMMMLVLGHVLALSETVKKLINSISKYCNTTANAAFIVCFFTLIVSFFNWGLGLIFGAIFARQVAELAKVNSWKIHYPIIGAAGYSGLMVWHGGISGSAPIKAAEEGHIAQLMEGIISPEQINSLPKFLSFSDTVFSSMNICISLCLLVTLPLFMYFLGKKTKPVIYTLPKTADKHQKKIELLSTAEKLDHSKYFALGLGLLILSFAFYKAILLPEVLNLNFISPNFINFTLLGLGLILHGSFFKFLNATNKAIIGTAGILIQFPIYFGIMGLMKESGMINQLSEFFVSISTETTFPIFTFFSAGLVNIFVPSGGGQWAIQGPIIIEASRALDIDIAKNIMALSYGDQLTNMLQPFWALPLLGITGLKAKEILPYTLLLMFVGALIFIGGLLLW